jgi:hypothetical protein
MQDDRNQYDGIGMGAICPLPECRAIAVAYGPPDCIGSLELWDFQCQQCGSFFTVPTEELIFRSVVPKRWLLARVEAA